MRILLCLLSCFILSGSLFGQSVFSVIRKPAAIARQIPFKTIPISRTLAVPPNQVPLAIKVCDLRTPCIQSNPKPVVYKLPDARIKRTVIEAQFAIARLSRPEKAFGGYNYLRTLAKLSYKPQNVDPNYLAVWRKINSSHSYNGAHHIVNKRTLQEIHLMEKEKAKQKGEPYLINLSEMQNNAPAIFHRLHGNPNFSHIFHNLERQLFLYREYGVKGIIEDFFFQLEQISKESNYAIPAVPPVVIENTYLEAELWSKTFNLRWE